MIGVLTFHLVLWFMISLFIINSGTIPIADAKYKRMRDKAAGHVASLPGAKSVFDWFWTSPNSGQNILLDDEESGGPAGVGYPMDKLPSSHGQEGGKHQKKTGKKHGGGGGTTYVHLHDAAKN